MIQPKRSKGGHRRYSPIDLQKFQQIKEVLHKQKLSLDEGRSILCKVGNNSEKEEFNWSEKKILLTGGTGSFGNHFCRLMLTRHNPKVIRIFSRDELKQHEMCRRFDNDPRLRFFIGDVRDEKRLRRALNGVDMIVHAAALKQVPACEYNPFEAVKTNIHGAQNIIDAAIDCKVKKVISLSTDKAVNPVNLYGATKLCSDKLFVQGNAYAGANGTRFSCVRYGNVIGSRGSVIPLFLEQKKTGTLTITDKRMTRFWITLDEAVDLVLKAFRYMQGGEIFIPKIPSMRIIDLAKAIAPDCKVKIIGIRPGEKLHEALTGEDEGRNTIHYKNMYVILPAMNRRTQNHYRGGMSLPEDFVYTSDTNDNWLSVSDLKKIIREMSLF